MKLFKATEDQYLDALLSRGSIKIGSFSEYRKQEELGENIGDKHDGMVNSGDFLRTIPGGELPQIFGGPGAATARISIQNNIFVCPDVLVFSLTLDGIEDIIERWRKDPRARYDAAYEITSFEDFGMALADELSKHYGSIKAWCGRVKYYDDKSPPFEAMKNPAFWKKSRYSWQREFRYIFIPEQNLGDEISGKIIDAPSIIKGLRKLSD